jgi:hypothetical protein
MDNSTLVAMNFGPLSWRPGIYLCLCSCVALCFMLKHLFLWILFRSLRQSLLKDALEYCSPCLASPLDIHEKRSRPCTASSLDIHEKRTSPDGHIQYDVFINYQNNEISANRFVDNLYEVLKSCGVRAFVRAQWRRRRGFRWQDKACHLEPPSFIWQSSLRSMLSPQNVCPSCMRWSRMAKRYSLCFLTLNLRMPGGSNVVMQRLSNGMEGSRDFILKRLTTGRTHCMLFRSSPAGNWPSSKGMQIFIQIPELHPYLVFKTKSFLVFILIEKML